MTMNSLLSRAHTGLTAIVLAALAVLPAFYLSMGLADPQGVPRIALAILLGWMFVGLVQVERAARGLTLLGAGRSSWANRLGLAVFVWLLVSSILGQGMALSFAWALAIGTYLLVAQSAIDWLEGRPARRQAVLVALGALIGTQVLFAIGQLASLSWTNIGLSVPVFPSSTGEPNSAALAVREGLLLLGAHEAPRPSGTMLEPPRLAELLLLTVPVLAAVSLLAARRWQKAVAGVALVAPLAVLTFVLVKGPNLATIFNFRLQTWKEAVSLWLQHPIAGVGLGWQQMMVATDIRNTPLHVAVELGAIGLILVIAALAVWFRETWRNDSWSKAMRIGLVVGVAALLIASLVSSPFASPVIGVAAALVIALGLSRTEAAEPTPMSAPVRTGYAFATLIVLGTLGWSTVQQVARPMLAASRFDFASQALAATDKRSEEQVVLALAERHAPGNSDLRLRRIENLVAQAKFDDAKALLAASKPEQLGPEVDYWAGRVSEGLKDPQAAVAAYERALSQLPASHHLVKPATERVAKLKPGSAAK
ncbi:hypothetical protein D3C72_681990 [compost metagenome]